MDVGLQLLCRSDSLTPSAVKNGVETFLHFRRDTFISVARKGFEANAINRQMFIVWEKPCMTIGKQENTNLLNCCLMAVFTCRTRIQIWRGFPYGYNCTVCTISHCTDSDPHSYSQWLYWEPSLCPNPSPPM